MAPKPKPRTSEPGLSRRVFLATSSKLYLFGALCATVGSTIVAACMEPDGPPTIGPGPGGKGDGYGYGYGYGYGDGCGYGYGYGCGY